MKKLWMFLAGLSLAAGAVEPELSFSFNDSLNHDKPFVMLNSTRQVTIRPVVPNDAVNREAMLVPGRFGNALHIGSVAGKTGFDRVVYFWSSGIVSGTQGSISFWVNPVDAEPGNRKNRVLLRLHTLVQGKEKDSIVLLLRNQNGQTGVRFYYGTLEGGNNFVNLTAGKPVWQKNQWHHIVATWGDGKITLYIDGEYAASKDITAYTGVYNMLSLGQQWDANPGSTLLDEVRIFRRVLTEDEVRSEYQRSVTAQGAGETQRPFDFALTERTVQSDGRIQSGEYAAGLALMSEGGKRGKNGTYAEYQPQAYFSYDQNNLYIAMKSRGDDLRCTISAPDGNVWEDDCIDFYFSADGKPDNMYHFIINSAGVLYDSQLRNGVERTAWSVSGMVIRNRVIDGVWHFEAAIPWSNFGVTPQAGEAVYFNICRSYRGVVQLLKTDDLGSQKADSKNTPALRSCTVTLAPGAMGDVRQYPQVRLAANTPAFEILPFGELSCQGQFASTVYIYASQDDRATVSAVAGALENNQSRGETALSGGQSAAVQLAGNWAAEGILSVTIATAKDGELFRGQVNYKEPNMVRFKAFRADPEKMELVVVATGGDNSGRKCTLKIRMKDWKDGKFVYEKTLEFTIRRGDIELRFDIRDLPPGLYDMHYEFADQTGKVIAQDYEYFAKPDGKAPWEGTTAGLGDIVPVPWMPVIANDRVFACWGRAYMFGREGLIASITSQNREILRRPVRLILNGKPVRFECKLLQCGQSFADYRLTALDNVPLTVDIHAEFDGFMWFTLNVGQAGFKVESLSLEIPMDRAYADAFDDCSSIYEKIDFSSWQNREIFIDPTKKPYFWCGNADVGLMGGVDSCRGWYFRDKAKGYRFNVTENEAVLTMQLVDTPVTLTAARKIEFYLHATPTKPKSVEAASLFAHEYHFNWYATRFYEWKAEGVVQENTMARFLPKREGLERCHAFYYYGTKGCSPHFPWWAWFGSQWNMVGDPTVAHQDSVIDSRRQRDYAIWTMTCMNSRSFLEHKIDMVQWHLSVDRYQVYDLYFDLAWPMPCYNALHGCRWVDEFGYIHYNRDMRALREFHKRAYILMKQKNPASLMKGHIRYTRLPSDVFFDMILVGEGYEGQVSEKHNYYGVLDPAVLRILYGYRSNEYTIELGPIQIFRTIFMFSPNLLKVFDPANPETDRAHRHFYAYAKCFNFVAKSSRPEKEPQLDVGNAAFALLGRNPRFYAPWDLNCGIHPVDRSADFLYAAYSGNNRVMIVALNDSDQSVTRVLEIDPEKLRLPQNNGKDIFNQQEYKVEGNRLILELPPRESRFIMF
ncbi:MAG: hypothetical protein E7053_09925 [Lentisphaerae bacterium]|nr:hypothetical protein [Lentisphaerota bacterium]